MGKFGFNPTKFIHWDLTATNLKYKEKYHTAYKKRPANTNVQPKEKYSTTPYIAKEKVTRNVNYISTNIKGEDSKQTSQNDYMKRHLYVKSCVDKEQSEWKFQEQKVSIRNYTPKVINQEINMGMWM